MTPPPPPPITPFMLLDPRTLWKSGDPMDSSTHRVVGSKQADELAKLGTLVILLLINTRLTFPCAF